VFACAPSNALLLLTASDASRPCVFPYSWLVPVLVGVPHCPGSPLSRSLGDALRWLQGALPFLCTSCHVS
jgi:hypothetical protein